MYETGSASGVVDLITKLEAFMATNGWTTDSFATEGSGKRLHAHRGSVFFNARAYAAETPDSDLYDVSGSCSALAFNLSTAGTGGTRWFDKTGSPVSTTPKYMSAGLAGITGAVPTYHFFAHNSGDNIIAVVEYAAGYFQSFGFGTLNKYGTYTGGTYFFGSRTGVSNSIQSSNAIMPASGFISRDSNGGQASPAFISLSVDAETGWHWSDSLSAGRDSTKRYVRCNEARFEATLGGQPNSLNDLAVMMPVECTVERETTGGHDPSATHVSPIGEIPGVYYLKILNLTPGQQITLGSDDYRVFPFYHKIASTDTPSSLGTGHSATLGFAVKE